jgi:hypothetical protein
MTRSLVRLERLEDRSVPAGNVTAEQVGTVLTLIGDDLSNSIRLLPGSQPNEIVVQGDATTVNGSATPQVFTGVENFDAHLLDGNDAVLVEGVQISTGFGSVIRIDGNAGNDRIEFTNTTINAGGIDVLIYGERVFETFASGTSGNDTIRLTGTSLTSQFGTSLKIYGDTNEGGVITGGNDEITIADSVIAARWFFTFVQVEIVGSSILNHGGQTSTIGGGNDRISIANSTIEAVGDPFSFQSNLNVTIVGDINDVRDATLEFTGADASGTIGGGNDDISITDTNISVSGPNTGTSQTAVLIAGDRNFVSGFLPENTATATIGGGNDKITIANSTISTTGGNSNGTFVEIHGDAIQVLGTGGDNTRSVIGGGNDRISVTDTPIIADGPLGDAAALVIHGDATTIFSGVSTLGGGNDTVTLRNIDFAGTAPDDMTGFIIDTGAGNDRLDIADSTAHLYIVHLGDGNDRLTFTNNFIRTEASLDGGPGNDRLVADGNTGPGALIWFNFEDADVTP